MDMKISLLTSIIYIIRKILNKFFQYNFSLERPWHFTFTYKYHTRHNFPTALNQCWHVNSGENCYIASMHLMIPIINIILLQCQITENSVAAITSLRNAKSMTPNSYVLPLYNPAVDWKHVYAITVSIIPSVNSSIYSMYKQGSK